jgi:hypothetical protein
MRYQGQAAKSWLGYELSFQGAFCLNAIALPPPSQLSISAYLSLRSPKQSPTQRVRLFRLTKPRYAALRPARRRWATKKRPSVVTARSAFCDVAVAHFEGGDCRTPLRGVYTEFNERVRHDIILCFFRFEQRTKRCGDTRNDTK